MLGSGNGTYCNVRTSWKTDMKFEDYWELKDLSRVLKVTFPGRISPKSKRPIFEQKLIREIEDY